MTTCVILTGASRGFGKGVVLAFAREVLSPIHFILTARSEADLESTKQDILSHRHGLETLIDVVVADLSDLANLTDTANTLFNSVSFPSSSATEAQFRYSRIFFVNNHGSLGSLRYIGSDLSAERSLRDMTIAFNLNVTSTCFLTSEFVKYYKAVPADQKARFVVVNVSSLAAIQPFDSWGVYCSGKAAREMFHKCLADEISKTTEKSHIKTFSILNYAPGPMDTDMQKDIRENPNVHQATQEYFRSLKETNSLVDINVSATKLVKLVVMNKFTSGDHIDFFDNVERIDSPLKDPTTCCACPVCTCGPDCNCKANKKPSCSSCLTNS